MILYLAGEKPYGCNLCNTTYHSKSGLNSHLKHKHPDIWQQTQNKKKLKQSK